MTRKESNVKELSSDFLRKYIGGRGLAARLLWDLNEPGVDPFSPQNHVILAVGPLTGLPLPSSGKMIIASKSPLTLGYGDGNLGTRAAVEMRKCGFDAVVLKGASEKPVTLKITSKGVEFLPADNLWGLGTHETERRLQKQFGKNPAALFIGPAGENKVLYATVISEHGRSGGRPGMGAVLGSKKVKAIVFEGESLPEPADRQALSRLGAEAYKKLKEAPNYDFWTRQGTMMTIVWSQKNSVLPTYNFREGVFDGFESISGDAMERIKVSTEACPLCNMPCRNYVKYTVNGEEKIAEPDYENVAMLGSNLGITGIDRVSHLNDIVDDMGIDAISTGSVIGFAMEASENNLLSKDNKIEWGDYKAAADLIRKIAYREGVGDLLADGTMRAARKLGGGSERYAMHVKGLEISAYDCHAAPGMALAYGTCSIGAHHKDAWFISLELKMGRDNYSPEKAEKLVWMQNIRGALFESFVMCRLPWVELGLDLDYYINFIRASTGVNFTWDELHEFAHRVYSLIRAFWVREYAAMGMSWGRFMDYPPERWFKDPLTKGPLAGAKLSKEGYDALLMKYYEVRGWDSRGVPKKETLIRYGLSDVATQLERFINLS